VRLTSQLIDVKAEDVTIGMKVQSSFRKLGQEGEAGVIHYGYKFRPAGSSGHRVSRPILQTPSACSQNRVRSEHLAFMTQHAIPLSGSGGTTKRPRSQAEEASPKPTSPSTRPSSRHGSFARLRTWFRRPPPPA